MANITPLRERLKQTILPELQKELGVKNALAVPRIAKVKVSVGFGKVARKSGAATMDDSRIKTISENISAITGQKPATHKAKKAISNFKTREGLLIGASVTLRGKRALDFLDRLINVAFPRVRDFRGIPTKLDGNGNYSVGIKDHTIFAEIAPDQTEFTHGLEVTVVTTATDDASAKSLLTKMGFPFVKPEQKN